MRHKELRIALVCYGGISLAVYMHGVTKELWKLARASRSHRGDKDAPAAVEAVYADLLQEMETRGTRLRVLPDVLSGASAGGINAVFLAQAIYSGQSLEPLTDVWLERADVEDLLDPEAAPMSRAAKFWAQPLVSWVFSRPGSGVAESVAPETRAEVRGKLSRVIRSRWFAPPFSGDRFSDLMATALEAMRAAPAGKPLLPPGHPLDLFTTTTDFHGYRAMLRLNSPPLVEETEHRMTIGFSARTPREAGGQLAVLPELVMAARATASFPGAFPPLYIAEIDRLATQRNIAWTGRDAFIQRIMPVHAAEGTTPHVALVDGSVLVNAPFSQAMGVLDSRPAQREVDRRFVYIDPTPHRHLSKDRSERKVGFFQAIIGSISSIPRQQPIRDNLEDIAEQSREARRLANMVAALRPEVEASVERLFGRTLFLDRPTTARLRKWRAKAQQAAAEQAGYAYHSYAQSKFAAIVDRLARTLHHIAENDTGHDESALANRLYTAIRGDGLHTLAHGEGGATKEAIAFFKHHDTGFRIRRLRLLARRLARDWEYDPEIENADLEKARTAVFEALALYFRQEGQLASDADMRVAANHAMEEPSAALDHVAQLAALPDLDDQVDEMLAKLLAEMPQKLRRRMLLAYLGFPFYDIATLPLLRNEGLTEFEPIKVDRISPEDANAIRSGGTEATLRGTEFYNFGAFFSRAYRENDYLWGRLHGAERMIDLIASTATEPLPDSVIAGFRKRLFHAILDEETERLTEDASLVPGIRDEVDAL
ncbi:patatin-like protein [Paraurantiacibacter namhicola]|nr:patatin-like protein [Paraurantiacibacter namhicola]